MPQSVIETVQSIRDTLLKWKLPTYYVASYEMGQKKTVAKVGELYSEEPANNNTTVAFR